MMERRFLHQLSNLLETSADLFFPNTCLHCGGRIGYGYRYLCENCFNNLSLIKKVNCSFCGASFENDENSLLSLNDCPLCKAESFCFNKCRSALVYDDATRQLIHHFKYNEMTGIAKILVDKAIHVLVKQSPFDKIDIACPVPLHPVRKRERGFNQSEILAKKISSYFRWSYKPNLIKRVRYTKSQTQLQGSERKLNVKKAFSIDKNADLKDLNIIVIDDVFTTGATVNTISEELKNCRAKKVYVMTIARAGLLSDSESNIEPKVS